MGQQTSSDVTILHVTAWSSATHSPTLSKTDDTGPPTPTDTPSAIAASVHAVNTHTRARSNTGNENIFNFKRDAVKIYKVTAGQTDCLD